MNGATLLLAIASLAGEGPADGARMPAADSAQASATASIRIVRGFKLTPAVLGKDVPGATVVRRVIEERDGRRRPARIVEFQ